MSVQILTTCHCWVIDKDGVVDYPIWSLMRARCNPWPNRRKEFP